MQKTTVAKKKFNRFLNKRYKAVAELKADILKTNSACENCGYCNFKEILEIAHINHGHDTILVNRSNCFLLCPTCHRAFDRGFIEINGEVSDCHLVKYRSPLVLSKAHGKINRIRKKTKLKWKKDEAGRFYTDSKTN